MIDTSATPREIDRTGIVAVLRAPSADAYGSVARTLIDAGVTCIELTLTTPNTLESLDRLRHDLPENAEIGIGSIRTVEQARSAVSAGASFIVTPIVDLAVLAFAREYAIPVYPGALTPTEVNSAWLNGASAVKLFPAATVGPGYIAQLHGPFPGLPLLPSGGVALDDIGAWIAAGAVAVSLGGPLLGDAFGGEPLNRLGERAERALALVQEARAR